MPTPALIVNDDSSATLGGSVIETQNNKDQPNGYLSLDNNGDAVGRWLPRSGSHSSMRTLVGEASEIAVTTNANLIHIHDGTTAGGKPVGLEAFVLDVKDFTSNAFAYPIPVTATTSYATAIAITLTDTRTVDKTQSIALGINPPKFVAQRLTVYINRNGNSEKPSLFIQAANFVFGQHLLDQATLATHTLDNSNGFTTATGRALSTGTNSGSGWTDEDFVIFDLVGIRYATNDSSLTSASGSLSWLVVSTNINPVDCANWVIGNYPTV